MEALRYLNKYLGQYKYLLTLGVVFTVIANALAIIPARSIKKSFELVQESITDYQLRAGTNLQATTYNRLTRGLLIYSGLIFLAAVLRGLFFFLARRTIMITGKRIEYALKNEIYAHYQTLASSFYRKYSTGDLMARISEDVNQVGMYLGPAIVYGLNTAVIFTMLIPYMLIINAHMTLYAVLPILLMTIGIYYISTCIQARAETIQHTLSELTTSVQESFSGIRILQAFTREAVFTKVFTQACNTYKARSLHLTVINAIFFPAIKGIIALGTLLVVLIGSQEVAKGRSSASNIAEFVMYLNLLEWPTFAVSWINNIVQKAAASQKRINEFLQEKNSIISTKSLNKVVQGHIAFKNVSFTYPNSANAVLRSVTFEIAAGKVVAILGTTGAGKSTIARLISRLYDIDTGEITIDGIPIQDYAVQYLRQQLGYVPQDVLLFSDTIKNNIAWGKPNATDAQIIQAVQLAAMYENIQKLPKQMATMLGERGGTLSGGQKQRIATARAFIRAPKILILDDCLSAVDAQTERKILHNIGTKMHGSTVLLISHRVYSAQFTDEILVLESGELVEQGTHEALLAHRGLYYALYRQQARQDGT